MTVAATMRQRVLTGTSKDFGLTAIGTVWGILMEMGYPEGWASLVALSDGTASLYLSSGGGVIGGGFHEIVRNAAIDLCRLADAAARSAPIVGEFQGHKLSPLFMASHEVITRLRLATEARDDNSG